jgi:hypothetical protein
MLAPITTARSPIRFIMMLRKPALHLHRASADAGAAEHQLAAANGRSVTKFSGCR